MPRPCDDRRIPGCINDPLRKNHRAPGIGFDHNTLEMIALHDHAGDRRMQVELDAGLQQELICCLSPHQRVMSCCERFAVGLRLSQAAPTAQFRAKSLRKPENHLLRAIRVLLPRQIHAANSARHSSHSRATTETILLDQQH